MALKQSDFDFIRQMIQQRAAIVLDDNKHYFVESRLGPVVEETGSKSMDHLIEQLRGPGNTALQQKVTEAITIHETSFFRDMHPFKALRESVFPDIIEKRGSERAISMWCGACSSGQEPYTVSMILHQHFPQIANWRVRFIATDISNKILDKAKGGRYSQLEINRGLPAPMLLKFFEKHGLEWQIKPEYKKFLEFRQLNLIENWPPMPKMDIIFLRNVLIYFDVATKRRILGKIRELLKPDGYLFLGAAEMPMSVDNSFERVNLTRAGCYKLK
jgi:chemotaxis protein methyltransferase CheR